VSERDGAASPWPHLLAIDLGLRTGFACFALGSQPRLLWYRSQRFSSVTKLKIGVAPVLDAAAPLANLVIEGDRHLGDIWAKLAEKRGALVLRVSPERWRTELLLPRQQRHGKDAKAAALDIAADVIDDSGAKRPKTPISDDVAEAICIGLWGLRHAAGAR
jgi:hypothetical protein